MNKEISYGVWRENENKALKQYPQKRGNKCLDCGIATRYFNQCMKCNEKMIAQAKIMD